MASGAPRRFLIVGHTQSTASDLPLEDLAGAAGRIDVLARAVTSALCLSHGLRSDTEVWTVIDHDGIAKGPRTVVWHGDRLRNLNPDERSTAALFRKAFSHDAVDFLEEVHPGLEVAAFGLAAALDALAGPGPLVLLDREGTDIRGASEATATARAFVLSDHRPWTDADLATLARYEPLCVSVGPQWLHGHHAITLVHDELDRRNWSA